MGNKIIILKYFIFHIFFINIFNPCFSQDISNIESSIKSQISNDNVVFSPTPRGFIIRFDDKTFFDKNSIELKENSYNIIESIAKIVKDTDKILIIEVNTDEEFDNKQSWEISILRANELTRYIICCKLLKEYEIKSIGFGNTMPIKNRINRIDFVLADKD